MQDGTETTVKKKDKYIKESSCSRAQTKVRVTGRNTKAHYGVLFCWLLRTYRPKMINTTYNIFGTNMAADAYNSLGGFSVKIPAVTIIDSEGTITSNTAIIGELSASTGSFTGDVNAPNFYGTFHGNIQGNLIVPGSNTEVIYNDNGQAGASNNFTFASNTNTLTVVGSVVTNSLTMSTDSQEYSTSTVTFATTVSDSPNQTLHTTVANTICSIDYTIIATDATSNTRQTSKLFASVLGTEVGYFEYGTIDVPQESPGVGDFRVVHDNGNVVLTVTPVTSNLTDYKIMITSYKE